MKRLGTLLAGVGLMIASGAIASADDDTRILRTTLYTPLLRADSFNCNVVNVSHKTLQIALALYDGAGHLISPAHGNPSTFSVPAATAAIFPTPKLLLQASRPPSDTANPR